MNIKVNASTAMMPAIVAQFETVGSGDLEDLTTIAGVEYGYHEAAITRYFIQAASASGEVGFQVENLTPDICDTSEFPLVSQVTTGSGRIKISNDRCSVLKRLSFPNLSSSAAQVQDFEDGTHAARVWNILKPMMDGSAECNVFANGPSNAPSGGYNSSCWGASFDFSGVVMASDWNNQWTTVRAGVLITDQHIKGPYHWQHEVGRKVRFLTKGGVVVERTIVSRTLDWMPDDYADWYGIANHPAVFDHIIYTLDSPVPDTVAVYPLCNPAINHFGRIATAGSNITGGDFSKDGQVPYTKYPAYLRNVSLWMNQDRMLSVSVNCAPAPSYVMEIDAGIEFLGETLPAFWYDRDDIQSGWSPNAGAVEPYISSHSLFTREGDSGCVQFVPIDDENLAILSCYTFIGSGPANNENILNLMIQWADDIAISNGALVSRTNKTVTRFDDPTL